MPLFIHKNILWINFIFLCCKEELPLGVIKPQDTQSYFTLASAPIG
jgi:hypothetical protein